MVREVGEEKLYICFIQSTDLILTPKVFYSLFLKGLFANPTGKPFGNSRQKWLLEAFI